jgi:hypothetical protein
MDKPNSMIQDKITSAIKDFSVKGKYRIIGSNATRGILYGSDYDANSKIEGVNMLTHIKKLYKHPPAIITDLKIGDTHWTSDDILKGRNGIYLLKDELKKDHMIKIDFVVPTVEGLKECSEVYYRKDEPKENVIRQLEKDIDDYLDTDTLKSMKRLVSILSLKKENKKLIQKLLNFFNTEVGLVNYCISNLETLELVKDKIDVAPYRDLVKEQLGRTSVPAKHVNGKYSNVPHLRKIVNEESTKFLQEMFKNV